MLQNILAQSLGEGRLWDLPQREFAQVPQHSQLPGLRCDRSAANLVTMTAFGLSNTSFPGISQGVHE